MKHFEEWRRPLLQWLLIAVAAILIVILWNNNTNQRQKDPFTTNKQSVFTRQVILSTADKSKEYRLRASVRSLPGADQVDYGVTKNLASIETVYWPNGGFTTFNDCLVGDYNMGHAVECTASNGNQSTYNVELLKPTN